MLEQRLPERQRVGFFADIRLQHSARVTYPFHHLAGNAALTVERRDDRRHAVLFVVRSLPSKQEFAPKPCKDVSQFVGAGGAYPFHRRVPISLRFTTVSISQVCAN